MYAYIKLGIATVLPTVMTLIFYLLDKKTAFGKISYKKKQLIIGIAFGLIAVLGTEWGIKLENGAIVNCRDASVITAGLIFGGPAGIIAGLIGGIERWFTYLNGNGDFTRIACTVSTILAGFAAAGLRKYMFENKKPSWILSFATGIVIEVFHLTMVFVTNISQPEHAFDVVKKCSGPMIIANGVGVCIASMLITLMAKEKFFLQKRGDKVKISQTIQRSLLICVVIALVVSSLFFYVLQLNVAEDQTTQLLSNAIRDVKASIKEASDENIIDIAYTIKKEINRGSLDSLSKRFNVAEINIVNHDGIVTDSTNKGFIGFDMKSGNQSSAFMCLIDEEESFVQEYGSISYDRHIMRKYAGVSYKDGFIQIGYNSAQFRECVESEIIKYAANRTVGQNGEVVVIDENNIIVLPKTASGKHADGFDKKTVQLQETIELKLNDKDYYSMVDKTEGYYIASLIEQDEAMKYYNMSVFATVFIEILIFGAMFVVIYMLIKKVVVNNVYRVNQSLSEISDGNMNVTVNVRSNTEFASLSDDINNTVDTLKHYIELAATRMDKDLELAKNIQSSALPTTFPKRDDFDIYACMDTAKEVGGDFYDFYFSKKSTINITIADVSGKGIPAAMFMMRAKSELKNLVEQKLPINDVFTQANEKLCNGNDAGMFVTAWQAQIDLKSGAVNFANAGHNPPIIRHKDGKFEYFKSRAGFVLAGMEGVKYRKQETQLEAGDIIFLYTDGITEATNSSNELYGEERLLEALNSRDFENMEEVCQFVKQEVAKFVGDAPQFDDMTMLAFKYYGPKPKPQIHFDDAKIDDIPILTEFVEAELEKAGCNMKTITQMNIAIDEIYSNIAKFAYENGGPVTVTVDENDSPKSVILIFTDEGRPYNPLTKEDPNVNLSAEERQIGGLGIYMVKKIMDEVRYEYVNEKNILTLEKYL